MQSCDMLLTPTSSSFGFGFASCPLRVLIDANVKSSSAMVHCEIGTTQQTTTSKAETFQPTMYPSSTEEKEEEEEEEETAATCAGLV